MENEIKKQLQIHLAPEFGGDNKDLSDFSVTNRVCVNVLKNDPNVAAATDCKEGSIPPTDVPTVPVSPSPTNITFAKPCQLTGDTNTCDGKVDILDYSYVSTKFGISDPKADVKPDGKIDILDYTVISTNFGKRL